jgi:ferric-dicitrate binding protein FerR (iron transport regulator)
VSPLLENDMNSQFEDIVIRVLEHRQNQEEMRIFSEWYHASDKNKQLFFQLKDIYERRKGGFYPDESEIIQSWERLWKKIDKQPTPFLVPGRRSKRNWYASLRMRAVVAAIALLLVVAGVWSLRKDHQQVTWTEVRTAPRSEPQTILLPDGSTVILNASSQLKYPEKFRGKNREIFLDGEAYFDVARDERRAFIVHSDQQDIHVMGTRFNVLGYSSDSYVITTLITGRVKLATFDADKDVKNEIVMRPNQQIYFDKKQNEALISEIDPHEAVTWMNGIYAFRDASLAEITQRLGKVMGIHFVISDEALKNEKYTGKFFFHQSPEEIADILNFKQEFRIQFKDDTILLQSKE